MGLLPRSCLLLVVVVLLMPAAIAVTDPPPPTTPTPCNTDICVKSCVGCGASVQVPDPEDCRRFYLCDGADGFITETPLDCSTGQVFNVTQHKCVEGDDCKVCSTPPASDCVYECEALADDPSTAEGSVNIAILADCQHYYECVDTTTSNAIPKICPTETPFFGGGECQNDETKCCSCRPYCLPDPDSAVGDLVADPLDCRKFYVCTETGAVPTFSGSCSDGEYFDSFLSECNDVVSCVTQCTNVVGADGCIEPLTCLETGFFARCPTRCTPYYYHCTVVTGEYQDVESCHSGTVFHPDTHTCVTEDNCPYPLDL